MARILIVDTDQERSRVLRLGLKGLDHLEDWVTASLKEAQELLQSPAKRPDLLLMGDFSDRSGQLNLLAAAAALVPRPAIIRLMPGSATLEDISEAKKSADDYLKSPLNMAEVHLTIERALNSRPARASSQIQVGHLVGPGEKMQQVFRSMLKAAASDGPVLLEGEVGVGKQAAAREIHQHSARRSRSFGPIRCAGADEQELASDLFGYEGGAWPGAEASRPGLLRQLDRGTLYLEDIARLSPRLQGKVLRLLEEQVYLPFRGQQTIEADVRIIASTTEPLARALQAGSFLPALYYRLSGNAIEIPPLRKRPFDIPKLVDALLDGREIKIAREAVDLLANYPWPGNMDELESVLAGPAKWCEDGRIEITDLPTELVRAARASGQKYAYAS